MKRLNTHQGFGHVLAVVTLLVVITGIAVIGLRLAHHSTPSSTATTASVSPKAVPAKLKTDTDVQTAADSLDTTSIDSSLDTTSLDTAVASLL
jgi:hypothetical protein